MIPPQASEGSAGGGARAFTVEYVSYSGSLLGDDLHERQANLRITSADGVATLENFGSPEAAGDQSIGRYQQRLDTTGGAGAGRVRALIDRTRPFDLPPATEGVPGVAIMSVILREGGAEKVKTFSAREVPQIEAMRPLLEEFSDLSAALLRAPVEVMQLRVRQQARDRNGRFLVYFMNVGSKPVCLANPYTLGDTVPTHWAGVQVAELPVERPGYTSPPLEWVRLGLDPMEHKSGTPDLIVLQPGSSFEALTKPWNPPHPNTAYLVKGFYCNYVGAREVEKVYRIRGCGSSDPVTVQAK